MNKAANPIPQGKYVPATRSANIIVTAGMTPRENGKLIFEGEVKLDEAFETYKDAVRQSAKNALVAAQNMLNEGEKIAQIMSVTVYINVEKGYTKHSKIADFASEYFCEILGSAGVAARTSIGVESLPGNAPCEISIKAVCE